MIQQLIAYGFVEEAYELAQPMYDRVLKNGDFYEWYQRDGTPAGSAEFKGSAGVLAKSVMMFRAWAEGSYWLIAPWVQYFLDQILTFCLSFVATVTIIRSGIISEERRAWILFQNLSLAQ